MAKAKRLLKEQLSRVDVVVELCDARLPRASRNPDLIALCRDKAHLLILQKSDLADEKETAAWLRYFRSLDTVCAAVDVNRQHKLVSRMIGEAAQERVARAQSRGIAKTVRVMVVGVPNVGKSTLIHRLNGGAIVRVGDKPGVTRSNQWVKISPYLEIMDTPGLLWPRLDDQQAALRLSYIAAIRDDIQDIRRLTICLLNDMMEMKPQAVMERFKVKDASLRDDLLLEAVCRGRGFLMKGGVPDEERACRIVLDEFRGGKLGRVTLEKAPPPFPKEIKDRKGTDEHQEAGTPADPDPNGSAALG